MLPTKYLIWIGILLVILLAWIAFGYFSVRNIEQPQYSVLKQAEGYEIREYAPYLIAETIRPEGFDDALNSGFMVVADYIFGNNTAKEPIAMTTPVTSGTSEPIAMTAPVISERSEPIAMTAPVVSGEEESNRTVAFVMPSKYTLDTLPKPNDSRVKIREVPKRKVAVLRFSGWYTSKTIAQKEQQLRGLLERDGLKYRSLSFAGYNPPWTPPFMTRNEIWAELVE